MFVSIHCDINFPVFVLFFCILSLTVDVHITDLTSSIKQLSSLFNLNMLLLTLSFPCCFKIKDMNSIASQTYFSSSVYSNGCACLCYVSIFSFLNDIRLKFEV